MSKKQNKPEAMASMAIGTRVKHNTDSRLDEGVVVWRHLCATAIGLKGVAGKEWSVHWSCGERGIYNTKEITKINPKNMKLIVIKEIEDENGEDNEEK